MNTESGDSLVEVIYISKSCEQMTQGEILRLINSARLWNEAHDITGALFYINGNFAQILEGSYRSVYLACDRIKRDSRYCEINQIGSRSIDFRRYPGQALRFFGELGLEKNFPHLARSLAEEVSNSKSLLGFIRNPA
jgi:hypothetical protein